MSKKLLDANGQPMRSTQIANDLLPNWQQGVIVRKYLDKNINRWCLGFGVRSAEKEVVLGFTYEEALQIVQTMAHILDGFTTDEKTRGVRK